MIKERETFLLLLNKHLVFFSTECLIARQALNPGHREESDGSCPQRTHSLGQEGM